MRHIFISSCLGIALFSGCKTTESSGQNLMQNLQNPPIATIKPHTLEKHGDVRIDNYYWLNDRENPEVIDYLNAENAYTSAALKDTEPLQELLFNEIKARIKQDDSSLPYKENGYWYYTRFEVGGEYPIYARRKGSMEAPEEILLNVPELAKGESYFQVGGFSVSPDTKMLAFTVDKVGRRINTIHFKNLETGEILSENIPNVTSNITWANDNKTLFYTKQDPETLRAFQIYKHRLGNSDSELVFEEKDDTFSCYVTKTKSKRYLLISSNQTLATEVRFLDADTPDGNWQVFLPRERNHEYGIDHYGNDFYVHTNRNAKNFKLMKTPVSATAESNWVEVIPHREDVYLDGLDLFKDYLVLQERKAANLHIRILPWKGQEHYLNFGEPAYTASLGYNPDFETDVLRYNYASLTTPASVFDYNMKTKAKTLMKQQPVLGTFKSEDYVTERLFAPAKDGTMIPISLVYKKGMKKPNGNPTLQYAYGSYGYSMDPSFSIARLSLLDRGFVYAIAHIRGGQEMGRNWYENGKLLKKINTFTDFIDVGRFLVQQKIADRGNLFAQGGSAGGLLMGAVMNMAPEGLYKGVIANVPFVDVVTTMLDDSIPLTTGEYDEWGNPNDKVYYDYMKSYSPYDQVYRRAYPHTLVTTGLHDSQVQYFEPAKWVAKLRTLKTDQNLLLLKTDMTSGHGGSSGRFARFKEIATEYAFILKLVAQ